tara:strand:+ start:422 stop:643 length:222 start_codon:yes stop_codon:yes gene_type:complete
MKRLLIPLILVLLTGCKYGSEYEAVQACDKWRYKQTEEVYIFCEKESSTRKILGIFSKNAGGFDGVVKKRFAY